MYSSANPLFNRHGAPARQCGASMLQYLFYLIVAVSFITVAIKLIPVYIEDASVKGSLNNFAKQHQFGDMTDREIKSTLDKSFLINSVRNLPADAVQITRDKEAVTVAVIYEVRVNMVGNVDAVVNFSHQQQAQKK